MRGGVALKLKFMELEIQVIFFMAFQSPGLLFFHNQATAKLKSVCYGQWHCKTTSQYFGLFCETISAIELYRSFSHQSKWNFAKFVL